LNHFWVREIVLETAKHAILSVTSSSDCFIFLPTGNKTERNSFSTFFNDQYEPFIVHFEDGDIELLIAEWINNAPSMSYETFQNSDDNYLRCQSWTARKEESKSSRRVNLFVQAIPIQFSNNVTGVLSFFRSSAPFSNTDLDCSIWIGRITSFCLSLLSTQNNNLIVESADSNRKLQIEVDRITSIESTYLSHDKDLSNLNSDLISFEFDHSKSSFDEFRNNLIKLDETNAKDETIDLLTSTSKTVFGENSYIECWRL
jgi:hypothetical protein